MKRRILSFLLLIGVTLGSVFSFVACDKKEETPQLIDYAAQVTLNMDSETLKQEVTVINYIDGDTTHFKVPTTIVDQGLLKARYLAVNTPESTGKIEEWGKKASNYTKEKLKSATSIIIETDSNKWEVDSTGERYLVWVWYKSAEMTDYRCLNIELLQNGLAVGSKASETRYGEICVKAIDQATVQKLHVHSGEKDPDYFYGEAIELDLKELRLNLEDYVNSRVAFEGIVTQYSNQGVFVENYDEEAQAYYGVYVYYGFFLSSYGQKLLSVGNRVRIVGSLQYYETGDSYQVSDLKYDPYKPDDPNNIKLLDKEKHEIPTKVTTAETFNSTLRLETEPDVFKDVPYAEVALNTTITMENLQVKSVWTTNTGGNNDGAMSLTCTVGDEEISIRTEKLYAADGTTLITADALQGKTITVKGIVDEFDGEYQIKVFLFSDITFHN